MFAGGRRWVGVRNLVFFYLTKLFREIGYLDMLTRESLWRVLVDTKYSSLGGGWCSFEICESIGLGIERTLDGIGNSFFLLDLCLEMGPRSAFCMMCGVIINH